MYSQTDPSKIETHGETVEQTEVIYFTSVAENADEETDLSETSAESAIQIVETLGTEQPRFVPGYISAEEEDILNRLISDYLVAEHRELDENVELWLDFDELYAAAPQHIDVWLKIVDKWDKIVQGARNGFLLEDIAGKDGLCFVVLGYRLNADGSMAEELVGRLEKAKELAESYPNAMVLCTGGNTNGTRPEAEPMREWLTANGIDAERILTEDISKSTVENVLLSERIFQNIPEIRHLVVVTSHYHVQGAAQLFAEQCILSGRDIDVLGAVPCNSSVDTSFSPQTLAKWMFELFSKQ